LLANRTRNQLAMGVHSASGAREADIMPTWLWDRTQ